MKLLFLHHQQTRHFQQEPGYSELFEPLASAPQVTAWAEFVYQTPLRQFLLYELALRGKRPTGNATPFILEHVDSEVFNAASLALLPLLRQAVDIASPDLIVYSMTWPTENIHPAVLGQIKAEFPKSKLFAQLWDHSEGVPFFHDLERELIAVSDFYAVADSLLRYQRIKARVPPYDSYRNLDAVHWLPTVHDPRVYRPLDLPKTTDVLLAGSSEGIRGEVVAALTHRYGPRFRHVGGFRQTDRYIAAADYVRAINEARIVVNTQTLLQRIQLKGRVREVLSCGAFLLEQDNPESRAFLDGSGVVLFNGYDDLFAKIDYYLAHDSEREAAARRAHEWYRGRYTPESVMQRIIDGLHRLTPA